MKPSKNLTSAILLALTLFSRLGLAEEVSVAVAANFTDATRQLIPLFEQSTGHTVKASFGSTGKLYSQIENGAPFEVFLAADTKRPAKAETEALAVAGSSFVYAKGKLVLWSAKPGLFPAGEAYLKTAAFDHLALANPKTAPYGLAAQQVMAHLGLLSALSPKLVKGDSIAQTFQFVVTGNAQAGFVASSQIKAWRGDAGSVWEIPAEYYSPIEQTAVLLKKGESNPAAQAFLDFLKSDASRKVIVEYGYAVE
jgi:molybdate transport system substrate-binding protein